MKKCLWKTLLDDQKSTSGLDMRKRKDLLCHKCDGTPEKAKELGCYKFYTKKGKI